jgi:quinol monooxygenase YgiN
MIHVIATIGIVEGKREEFLKHFHDLIPHVLAEEGCVEYGPAVDLQTSLSVQPPVRPDVVTVIEKWEDLSALELHLVAPHMADYRKLVGDMVLGTEVCVLEPA